MNDQPPNAQLTTSALLSETIEGLSGSHINVGELIQQFQRRSFGGVLLILALLAMVPGISVFAGAAMLVPAYQLMIGLPAPLFPRSVSTRSISVAALKRWGPKVIYWVAKLERLVKPRWPQLTSPLARRIMGAMIMVLGLIITIPFPFSNFPPSVAIVCFALGLLERDGVMTIIGSAISLVACAVGFVVFYVVIDWLTKVFS